MGRKKRVGGQEPGINMTPMIDVVFQMIIFFVTTAELDRKSFDEKIRLALAPHGPAVEDKDPRTVTIELDNAGRIQFGRGVYVSTDYLRSIMKKTVAEFGQTVPVVIRADGEAKHSDVKKVMDACSMAGLWKIKFAATKELAKDAK